MKRIFPIIITLITLSLIGIVIVQISWLKSMLVLREDQVKQKVEDVAKKVGNELAEYKGAPTVPNKILPGFGDDFSFEITRPYSLGHRFTAQDIYEKIKAAFASQQMENIPF